MTEFEKALRGRIASGKKINWKKISRTKDFTQLSDEFIREYAHFLFEKDYSLYTAKQWGIKPSEIDVSVLKRVPVNFSYKDNYFEDTYQVMPKHSFTQFFNNLLNHENITVKLNEDALKYIEVDTDNKTIKVNPREIIFIGGSI